MMLFLDMKKYWFSKIKSPPPLILISVSIIIKFEYIFFEFWYLEQCKIWFLHLQFFFVIRILSGMAVWLRSSFHNHMVLGSAQQCYCVCVCKHLWKLIFNSFAWMKDEWCLHSLLTLWLVALHLWRIVENKIPYLKNR